MPALKNDDKTSMPEVDYKTFGYIGGMRLDSIDAQYGELDFLSFDKLTLNMAKNGKEEEISLLTT